MITLTGDINLTDNDFDSGFGVGSQIKKGINPFVDIPMKDTDIWIGNFEGVTAYVSKNSGVKRNAFRIEPQYLKKLNNCNYYNVSNNHAMQHGSEAYKEMIYNLESLDSKVFGDSIKKSQIFEHLGLHLSVTGFCLRKENFGEKPCYWYNPEVNEIKEEVDSLKECDFKIAYIHWGCEYIDRPYNEQVKFAHLLIDLGFDLIVGLHPHLLQGYEDYKGKRIYYSIGNFVFNKEWEPFRYGALVHVNIEKDKPIITHSYVRIDNSFPKIIDENYVPTQYRFSYLNSLIKFNESYEEYAKLCISKYKEYRKINRKQIIKGFVRMKPSDSFSIILDFVKRKLNR